MANLRYIDLAEAIRLHQKTVEHSGGGTLEHFDLGRLDSVLQNIQNDDYYPTFAEKITHFLFFKKQNEFIIINAAYQILYNNN